MKISLWDPLRILPLLLTALIASRGAADGPTLAVTQLAPANGAVNVCIDTPLRLTFGQTLQEGTSGSLRVYQANGALVDTITVGAPSQRFIGGAKANNAPVSYNYYPVIVTGSTVGIYLHQALAYGQTYYVTVDAGALTDTQGKAFPGFTDAHTWRFTTKAAPPAAGTAAVTVAADGTGDFATVQGAIDFAPENNTKPFQITVRPGAYTEMDYIKPRKDFITIRGTDRDKTIIQYADNNKFNAGHGRALFGVDANDFTLENVTLHNTTPYHGSQAETLRTNGQRILLVHDNFLSFQDTLWLTGATLISDCYIEGDVDFMWGSGPNFYQNCELKAMHAGYYTQIRNAQGKNGNVYVHCRLTRASDLADTTQYLSRIDPTVYPYSQVVYIDCAMDKHIRPVGWLLNNATTAPTVQFWEYGSTDGSGKPLDVSQRAPFSRQLTASEAAQWRDPAFVLGGWSPKLPVSAKALP